ncbi:MAG: DUF3783 domain-containing protein [Ruminococcus sp.]|nr:DUF3783 domain-containing protein [Ruminococcus sp.]
MKARTLPAVRAVLIGGFDDNTKKLIEQSARRFGAKTVVAGNDDLDTKIKTLISGNTAKGGEVCSDRFMIMNPGDFASAFIDELKAKGVSVPLKAVVTLHSQEWTLKILLDELKQEHMTLTRGQDGK